MHPAPIRVNPPWHSRLRGQRRPDRRAFAAGKRDFTEAGTALKNSVARNTRHPLILHYMVRPR